MVILFFSDDFSDNKELISRVFSFYFRLNSSIIIMPPATGSATAKKTTKTSSTGKTASGAVKKGKKKIAAAPLKSKVESKKLVNPLYEKRAKNFGIGQGKNHLRENRLQSLLFFPSNQIFNLNVI